MTQAILHETSKSPNSDRSGIWLAGILTTWVAIVLALAMGGTFDVPANEPALPTLLAIAVPVGLFVVAMGLSPRLRELALSLDPVLATEFQAWRILGGIFLAVYAFGHLPGFFAWPAGLGDMAVGVAAPFMAWQLRRNPEFLTSARFRWFNYLGLTDFVIALATGIAARGQIAGLVDQVTTAPIGQLPLVLIPTIAVPIFIVLHLIVLMQIASTRR